MKTHHRCRRAGVVALALALWLPGAAAAQSPDPGAPASPGPTVAPSAGPTVGPDAERPPDGWATAVCTAYARVLETRGPLTTLGRAALDGDPDGMAVAAITAGLLGDQALRALETLDGTWMPGAALSGYLTATGFGLVDLGLALAEAGPDDADALRAGLGSAIAALDGLARTAEEAAVLRDTLGFDCAAVPVPTAAPLPLPSGEPPTRTPVPDVAGDAELEARFPAQVGGVPLSVASRTGAELLATSDPGDPVAGRQLQDLTDFLAANGHTVEDISLAFAFVPVGEGGASITAFRVRGGEAAALLDGLIPLVTIDYQDPRRETVSVAGRALVRMSDGSYDPGGIYEILLPIGDTVWAISASGATLEEIVAALAG